MGIIVIHHQPGPPTASISPLYQIDQEKKQVHIIGSIGGEAHQLTHFVNGASKPISVPCSTKLLLSTGLKEGENLNTVKENDLSKEVNRYDRIKYKWDGRGYFDQLYQQLVIADIF
ncbi:hypothetical protein RCO48_06690 [Peribacillus frigoritolerans]|nr:hypothetical protein [Peribacillus frigoritolerans]